MVLKCLSHTLRFIDQPKTKVEALQKQKNVSQMRWCPMAANKHRNSRQNLSKQENPRLLFFFSILQAFFGDKNIKYLLFTLSRGI